MSGGGTAADGWTLEEIAAEHEAIREHLRKHGVGLQRSGVCGQPQAQAGSVKPCPLPCGHMGPCREAGE